MIREKEAKRKVHDEYENEIKTTPEIVEESSSENGNSGYFKMLLKKRNDLICSSTHELYPKRFPEIFKQLNSFLHTAGNFDALIEPHHICNFKILKLKIYPHYFLLNGGKRLVFSARGVRLI